MGGYKQITHKSLRVNKNLISTQYIIFVDVMASKLKSLLPLKVLATSQHQSFKLFEHCDRTFRGKVTMPIRRTS